DDCPAADNRLARCSVDNLAGDRTGGQRHFTRVQHWLQPKRAGSRGHDRSASVEINVQVLRLTGSDGELPACNLPGRNLDARLRGAAYVQGSRIGWIPRQHNAVGARASALVVAQVGGA